MILFPPCKINIGLRILRKRSDGFHDLETLFWPVPLRDALEMLPSDTTRLHVTGADIPGAPSTNLCVRAHALLAADFPAVRPVDIYLHKSIPMGAGLGGGSADGALALVLVNRLFRLGLTREDLLPYALQLGSDCPFFLYDGPCWASGRGEILQPAALDLSDYRLVLVNPGIHVPTGWAFAQLGLGAARSESRAQSSGAEGADAQRRGEPDAAALRAIPPVSSWRDIFHNDFEPAVFAAYPAIKAIKETLYATGAVYASMSGSGSTVYALYPEGQMPRLSFPKDYWVYMG
ncbi:4-(cytidine 5'-diphospho)-2-C-methyl-D-erythritol kinase [Dinghuibacter silviterrae]|uniref:4-diphosphocytidyl-2-C-methyl-D-erythritol kinase n=1 Tax=Dinghuibacter silviterrae TaxID=1539049 RepID=A0A4R8DGH9_9BACT|nr:4-(cytidine 5'-diphospho)-2-C-methyl-D-erythritol kinase [Dinghuibacter silviterrae]TDW96769.1 4-diphosphocytidyl-2-C-methyl-D-erythritol kinase [Dinghuibacter silviterrae]